jgi:hypothetical protein
VAVTSVLKSIGGTIQADYFDTVTHVYEVSYDAVPTNFYAAYEAAKTATGAPVPARGAQLSGQNGMYAGTITPEPQVVRTIWLWTVTYSRPQPEDLNNLGAPGGLPANPLLYPVVFNVSYMDREYVIQKAKNVEALSHGDGKGGNRAASTLGPIVNAAGKRPDEPLVDTERLEILVIRKNFATLADIVSRNRTYKRTTNSATVQGYTTRQLRYLLTESEGKQILNGIEFWPGVTTVLAEDTTDLTLDNVGYEYWDAGDADWKRAVDADGNAMADPINLKLDGDQAGDNTTTITYRHLSEVAYSSLFE